MKTFHTIQELRQALRAKKAEGLRIALVPTMGNLHAGHISLIEEATNVADIVVATIFVNPLQFGANEDLDKYPRTLQADQDKLSEAGCDFLLAPSVEEVYPEGREQQTIVEVPGVSNLYCGASRPGHFTGVTTVVAKIFGMVQPDVAVFGEKDYQQLFIIRKMTRDLCMPVEIIGVPIKRNANGLALSSRNGYLDTTQLKAATALNKALHDIKSSLLSGVTNVDELVESTQMQLENSGFKRDYLVIARQSDLQPMHKGDTALVILAAAYMGSTRLIDNLVVNL